jgi:hypothetical protein
MAPTSPQGSSKSTAIGIQLKFASVAHPQTNRQVEKANEIIWSGIKKRLPTSLKWAKGAWVEKLPSVLWSFRTTPNTATQQTPLFMVHGAKVVLQVEITHDAPRVAEYEEVAPTKAPEDDMDVLDESHDVALTRATTYQQNLQNHHSRRLRPLDLLRLVT